MADHLISGEHGLALGQLCIRRHFPYLLSFDGPTNNYSYEDALSAAMLRAYKDLKRWDPEGGVTAASWFYGACHRGIQDFIRSMRPGKRNPIDVSLFSLDRPILSVNGESPTATVADIIPDDDVDIEQEATNIVACEAALDSLSYRLQAIARMYFYMDMSLREIAELEGLTESRISQLLTKAKEQMREHMERSVRVI